MTLRPPKNGAGALENALPHLRRYARALTGNQDFGDQVVARTLERLVENPKLTEDYKTPRMAMFHACYRGWTASGATIGTATSPNELQVQLHLSVLSKNERAALLLTSLEGFSSDDAAIIMGIDTEAVDALLSTAYAGWQP